ncbi:MAG: hypothetical protein ACR2NZ_23635 [Rubripirellula sp.]
MTLVAGCSSASSEQVAPDVNEIQAYLADNPELDVNDVDGESLDEEDMGEDLGR